MIDTPYILQLKKQYKGYLKNVILGKAFEPLVLRGGKDRPQRYEELDRQVRLFQQFEKGIHPQGWSIEWEDWTSKKVGKQLWPSVIKVDTEEDYLFLIDKQEESGLFKEQLERLCGWKPGVRDFLYHKPEKVLELKDKWTGICGVIDYLLTNDVAGMYLRSLVVPVHTKFIEEHKGIILDLLKYFDSTRFPVEAKDLEEVLGLNKYPYLFEARWLDNELAAKYTAGMKTFAVEASWDRCSGSSTGSYLLRIKPIFTSYLRCLERLQYLAQGKHYICSKKLNCSGSQLSFIGEIWMKKDLTCYIISVLFTLIQKV